MASYFRQQEAEMLRLAERYERTPEDRQKAEGAKEARRMAAIFRKLAEEEEQKEADRKEARSRLCNEGAYSAEDRNYGAACPWNAPGMSVKDFI